MSRTDRRLAAALTLAWLATAALAAAPAGPAEGSRKPGELSFGLDSGFVMTPLTRSDPYSFGARVGAWASWAPASLGGLGLGVAGGLYGFRALADTFGPSSMWAASGAVGYTLPLSWYDGPGGASLTAASLELLFGYYERMHEFLGSEFRGSRLLAGAAARLAFVDGPLGSSVGLALLVPLEARPLPLLELGMRVGLWP